MLTSYFKCWAVAIGTAVLTFFCAGQARATHALGGEITYECLGNDQYRVNVSFFFDCSSSFNTWEIELDIVSQCGMNQTVQLTQEPAPTLNPPFDAYVQPYEIPIYCEESNCGNGNLPGIKEYKFSAIVTLPPCAGYTLSFTENARSESIQTISTPGSEDIHVEAFLNNLAAPCNSSPQFDLPARGIVCLNQDNLMLHTATDVDGDLLVYSLYAPLVDVNEPVNYLNGYNQDSIMTCNYQTFSNGELHIYPTQLTVAVLGVLVEEYRNGVLIGSVMRDMQVTVVNNCPTYPEGFFETDNIIGFDADSVFICTSDTLRIDVYLGSTDPNQIYHIEVGNIEDFPGATFETEPDTGNPGSVIGHFVWEPDLTNINQQNIAFQAYDESCPLVGYSNFTYRIFYKNIIADANPGIMGIACNDSVLLEVELEDPIGDVHFEWQNGDTLPTYWAGPGNYSVTVVDSLGCSGTDEYIVYLNNYPVASFEVNSVCLNENVQPFDLSFNYAETGETPLELTNWYWDFGDGTGTSTDTMPNYVYTEAGSYEITLVLTNENNCLDTFSTSVVIHPLVDFDASASATCIGQETQFTNNSSVQSGSVASWSWDFNDNGATSSNQSPIHTFSATGTYNVTLEATTNQGCESDTVIEAVIAEEAVASFTYSTEPDCGEENLRVFLTNESENAEAYLWDFGNATDTAANPIYDTPDGNGPLVTLVAYANPGLAACSDTMVVDITDMFLGIDFDTINAGNIITPNGDGFNDCLAPFWHEAYEECYRLRIWDRWGMFIYDSDDVTNGQCWPGTDRKGHPVSNGTFFFVAEVNSYSRAGYVTVAQ